VRLTIPLACLLVLAATTAAFAATHIYSGAGHGSFPVEPTKLKYTPSEIRGHQSFLLKNVVWEGWGHRKAIGEGQLTSCFEGKSCFTSAATAKASERQNSGSERYYTKLKLIYGQNKFSFRIPTPSG
jgi:hypothetical protein